MQKKRKSNKIPFPFIGKVRIIFFSSTLPKENLSFIFFFIRNLRVWVSVVYENVWLYMCMRVRGKPLEGWQPCTCCSCN